MSLEHLLQYHHHRRRIQRPRDLIRKLLGEQPYRFDIVGEADDVDASVKLISVVILSNGDHPDVSRRRKAEFMRYFVR